MPGQLVNYASLSVWLVLLCAILLLTPITSARLRTWMWALVNLLFLYRLLDGRSFVGVVLTVAFSFVLVHALSKRRWRFASVLFLGVGSLALFLLHKFPTLFETSGYKFQPLTAVLTSIGFSYVFLRIVDMSRVVIEERQPAPSLPSTINYLLPFHMIAAGPIQSYDVFAGQPAIPPRLTTQKTLQGVERIACGLFKKFVLAFLVQKAFLTGFTEPGWYRLVEAQAFYLWLFLDFSALSDIAFGTGILLGVATPENFNRPYVARNLIDFWERWHISLSQFIRRNLFIPIQLTLLRRSEGQFPLLCASAAFVISFALCGLWHRGSLLFLAWGLFHALGLLATNLYRDVLTRKLGTEGMKRYLENKWIRAISTIATFEYVAASLVLIQFQW